MPEPHVSILTVPQSTRCGIIKLLARNLNVHYYLHGCGDE